MGTPGKELKTLPLNPPLIFTEEIGNFSIIHQKIQKRKKRSKKKIIISLNSLEKGGNRLSDLKKIVPKKKNQNQGKIQSDITKTA